MSFPVKHPVPFTAAAVFLSAGFALSAPFQWGGGSSDLTDGAALAPTSGLWFPDTLENWAHDNGTAQPTDFTFWTNGNEAVFGADDIGYTVEAAGNLSVTGLHTEVFSGGGSGPVEIRGWDAASRTFTIESGAVIDTPAGTTLRLRSDSSHALSIVSSSFSKTGAGSLEIDTKSVANTNSAGAINLDEGTIRVLGDRPGLFSAQNLFLNSPTALFETGQLAAANGGVSGVQFSGFDGVAGSRVQSHGAGTSHIAWLNSAADGSVENLLLTDGEPGSRLGLVKAGNKTLTLNHANSYTGGTSVVNGRLVAGVAGAVPGLVSVSGAGVFEPAATRPGPAAISVEAGGRLILKSTVNPDTLTLKTGGNLEIPAASDLPAIPDHLPSWAGTLTFAYPLDQPSLLSVPPGFPGTIALGIATAENLDFSTSGAALTSARLGAVGNVIYSGNLTPFGNTYRLGGGGNLTLDQTAALTGEKQLEIGHSSEWLRAALPAASVVSLTGANDLSGAVTIGRGHTLRLEGLAGSLASATAYDLRGGTLSLVDAVDLANGNRISDNAPITFRRGGTLNYLGTRNVQELAGAIRVPSGEATVSASGNGLGATGAATIRFSSLESRGDTTTITFANGTNNSLRFTASPPLTNGIAGGWSISGGANFTDFNPTNGQPRQITPGILTSETDLDAALSTGNYTFDSAVSVAIPKNRSVNSLRAHFATGGPFLVDLGPPSFPEAPNVLTLESGGLLLSSNIGGTLAGGALTAGAASGNKLFAFTPSTAANSAKTIASPIIDNNSGPVKLIKGGAGQLILTSENTYSGGTHINNGNLQIAASANLQVLGTGPIAFDGSGTTLSLGNNVSPRSFGNAIEVNADSTFSVPSGQGINVTFSGPIALAADSLWTVSGNVTTLSGPITGDGSLRFTQGSAHTISGSDSNTFSGGLSVLAGTLTLNKSGGALAVAGPLFIGDTDGAFAQEIVSLGGDEQIIDTAVVTLTGLDGGNQGVLRLNGNHTETIAALVSGAGQGVVENGGASGTVSVLNLAPSSDASFGGTLRNHNNGDATRPLLLNKSGAGTQRLAGQNLHTGATTVSEGTLQIDGALPFSEVQVLTGGTLSGIGSIGSATIIEGRHQPGHPGGSQHFTGSLGYGPAARLVIGIPDNSNVGASSGSVTSATAVNIQAGAAVEVRLNQPGSRARFSDAFWQSPRSWRVVQAESLTGNFALGTVSPDSSGVNAGGLGAFSLTNDATGTTLAWTPSGTTGTPLQSWRQTHFGTTLNEGQAADGFDADRDGVANLIEFLQGSLPKTSDASPPILTKVPDGLDFRYRRNKAAALYLQSQVRWSDDLVTWSAAGVTSSVVSGDADSEEISAIVPLGSGGKRFVQLKAIAP